MYLNRGPIRVNLDSRFTRVFNRNLFHGDESVSGVGSNLSQTRELIDQMPLVLQRLEVETFLDIPCGDFNWMSQIKISKIKYTGADIVAPLVEQLKTKFASPRIDFINLNLVREIPKYFDVIFSRDLLVHLNHRDALKAIRNVIASNSKYFFTTTFPLLKVNRDLPIFTREIAWRPLNLELAPFRFPPPMLLLNEKCSESGGQFADKSIGVWKISELTQ